MRWANRHWIIVDVSDITDEMIENAIQTSMNTLRKTNDDSKAILKWDGPDTPSCFDGMTQYNHSDILTELSKEEWQSEL
tara:strand:+ start:4323 stop:4559 length:237 start_codon:yes stop_codon:yes gene_type:complete